MKKRSQTFSALQTKLIWPVSSVCIVFEHKLLEGRELGPSFLEPVCKLQAKSRIYVEP